VQALDAFAMVYLYLGFIATAHERCVDACEATC
jgi:hypothetical protein